MYDPGTKQNGLLKSYINTSLKCKQQASLLPENNRSDEEKYDYVRRYYSHEAILFEKIFIQSNPCLRSLSNVDLNFFYGNFGQRTNINRQHY